MKTPNIKDIKLNYSYDLNTADFKLDVLQQEMLNFYLTQDMKFRRAFNIDFTSKFIQFLKDKSNLEEPLHLSAMGIVRSGKSMSMLTILFLINYYYGRLIDIRYVTANSFEFLERLKDMKIEELHNSCFQIDEEKNVFGVGSLAKKTKLTDVQNIIAKQNISTISICPIKFPNQDAFYGLRAFGRDFKQGVNRFMLYNLQESGKGGQTPMGNVYIPILKNLVPESVSKPILDAYNKKKDEWILKETRGEGDVLYAIKRRTAEHFARDKKFLQIKKKDEKIAYISASLGSEWARGEVLEVYNLTNLAISNLLPPEK